MPKALNTVLSQIAEKKIPLVILVGGSSEFLSQRAFREIRDAVVAATPNLAVESFEPGAELAGIIDSYRTMSLFAATRLLIVPEVNAFVSSKELFSLYEKAGNEWRSAKTDRKRTTASAKLLHVLGLVGADLEMPDPAIAAALGLPLESIGADEQITRSLVCFRIVRRSQQTLQSMPPAMRVLRNPVLIPMSFHCRSPLPQEMPLRLSVALPSGTGWK